MSDSTEKANIFVVADPENNVIYLSHRTWNDHITSGHPEMSGEEDQVKKTIEDPERIYRDVTYPNDKRNYFRKHEIPALSSYGNYMKVVVSSDSWDIITAYITKKHKQSTELLYEKNEEPEQN